MLQLEPKKVTKTPGLTEAEQCDNAYKANFGY